MSEETIYLRNLHGTEARVTLASGRRIDLKPRGQRGDMTQVSPEEQKDQGLRDNYGLIYEPLTEATAVEILAKQDTNRKQPHTALASITNELGQPMKEVVVDNPEDRAIVAGTLTPQDGKNLPLSTEAVSRDIGPEQIPVPGSVGAPTEVMPEEAFADNQLSAEDILQSLRQNSTTEPATKG